VSERVLAPFGRRACRMAGAEAIGAYRLLRVADPEGPRPWPGQFYMLAAVDRWGAGEDDRPYLPRAFSFLSAGDGTLEFLLEDVGPGTRRLGELRTGEDMWIAGPFGNGFALPKDGRRPILCGGGVGVPPLVALRSRLDGDVSAILGFRDAEHAEAAGLLDGAQVATDDGSVGHHGLVTELLAKALGDDVVVYSCGPPAMLEAVRVLCTERDVPAQLALESGMACGFGACWGCVVATRDGYRRVCVDGPVLEAAELDSALLPGIGH